MSLNQLLTDIEKPWLNCYVNELTATGFCSLGNPNIVNAGLFVNGKIRLNKDILDTTGAIDANVNLSANYLDTTAGLINLNLPAGGNGQLLNIVMTVNGNNAVINGTASGLLENVVITFANVGDSVSLLYAETGWAIVGSSPNISIV